jgi:hypothetical protein
LFSNRISISDLRQQKSSKLCNFNLNTGKKLQISMFAGSERSGQVGAPLSRVHKHTPGGGKNDEWMRAVAAVAARARGRDLHVI